MLKLRRATASDADAASRIIEDALAGYGLPFDPDGRDADVATFGQKPEHDDLVVEDDGAVVGIASVGPQGEPGVAWVSKVFVASSARRRGVGRQLMTALHDHARRRGYRSVGLRTRVVFREAIALYESLGYRRNDDAGPQLTDGDIVYERAVDGS